VSVELLIEDVDVVESSASISLCPSENHYVNANSLTDLAGTVLPRLVPENPSVNICMISLTVKDMFVVAERLDCLCNRGLAPIEFG